MSDDPQPLYCVAWRDRQAPPDAPAEGRTRRPALKFLAEQVAEAANQQFPNQYHWVEEVSADE